MTINPGDPFPPELAQGLLYQSTAQATTFADASGAVCTVQSGAVTGISVVSGAYTTAPYIAAGNAMGQWEFSNGIAEPVPYQPYVDLPSENFMLVTVPGITEYAWSRPDMVIQNMRISNIGLADRLLMLLPGPPNAVGNRSWPSAVGNRSWPSAYFVSDDRIVLWPTPDAAYELHWTAYNREAWERQRQQAQFHAARAQENYRREHDKAAKKAAALLIEWLNPEQLAEYEDKHQFHVTGQSGTKYRITPVPNFGVYMTDKDTGQETTRLCFVPSGAGYLGDIMLAQKIMLETDEKRALKIANKHPVAGPGMGLYAQLSEVTRRAFGGL